MGAGEMDPAPRPSLREWITIIILLLIFFWIPILFIGAELNHPRYLFLEKFLEVRIHEVKVGASQIEGETVVLYWHEDNHHANVYCGVYAQDENGFRAATYSEFVALENRLRPH